MRMRGYSPKEFKELLVENGWQECRDRSNHVTFSKPDFDNIITVPTHHREISRVITRRLLKEAGIHI